MSEHATNPDVRGREAGRPTQVPKRGWKDITKRTVGQIKDDHVPLMAAGVAFYAMLAIFPALIALVTVYGLIASPSQITSQLQSFTSGLPQGAATLIEQQIGQAAQGAEGALTVGLVVSLLGVLWSASGGVGGLIKGVNVAYDEDDQRNFFVRRGLALLLTIGGIVFIVVALAIVAVVPAVLSNLGLPQFLQVIIAVLRWPLLALFAMFALAVVYRLGPDRDAPEMRWVSTGAVVATVLWIIGSLAFSFYVRNFGSYDQTYGALGGVIVLLLWLFLSSFIVLLGAEINAESERQTRRDTTRGRSEPLGERGAYAAGTVGESSA